MKLSGLKFTKQREAILNIFIDSDRLLTADDVYLALSSSGLHYGLATVYRTISMLCENSLLQIVTIPSDNCQYFVFSNGQHMHHLICTECKKCIPIDVCPVKQFSESMALSQGFKITGHAFQIFGLCEECSKKK